MIRRATSQNSEDLKLPLAAPETRRTDSHGHHSPFSAPEHSATPITPSIDSRKHSDDMKAGHPEIWDLCGPWD